jgi:L-aminopeptidase/D-esterase-like protein
MILKRKLYTKYDDTDRLKQMRDSDILAERKKKGPGYASIASDTAAGAVGAGVGGAVIGGATGLFKKGSGTAVSRMAKGAGNLGKAGLVVGAIGAGAMALRKRSKAAKDNQFYNDRLEYAQRQAKRREKKDWKTNMTQRESYTY